MRQITFRDKEWDLTFSATCPFPGLSSAACGSPHSSCMKALPSMQHAFTRWDTCAHSRGCP